jgi:hypothetical protein
VSTAVAEATPVTTPEEEPTDATSVLLEDQVPPVEVVAAVMVAPTQTLVGPVIASGNGLTVTVVAMPQPVDNL